MTTNNPGRLVVVEGPENTGKSTFATALTEALQRNGVPCRKLSFPGRESGSLGALIYRLEHQRAELGVSQIAPSARQILHLAAHLDAIEQYIAPVLAQGTWIILDRYWWSMWAHGIASGVPRELLESLVKIEKSAWRAIQPAVIFCTNRPQPFSETPDQHWHDVRLAYESLAISQTGEQPIEVFPADAPMEERLKTSLARIAAIRGVP